LRGPAFQHLDRSGIALVGGADPARPREPHLSGVARELLDPREEPLAHLVDARILAARKQALELAVELIAAGERLGETERLEEHVPGGEAGQLAQDGREGRSGGAATHPTV